MELGEWGSKDYYDAVGNLAELLNEGYDQRIEVVECGLIIEEFRCQNSAIRELVVVARGEQLSPVVTTAAWRPFIDEKLSCVVLKDTAGIARGNGLEPRVTLVEAAFEMACHGVLRLVPHPQELDSVPDAWKPYLMSLEELPAGRRCRTIREGEVCYMSFAEETGGEFRPRRKGRPGTFTL